ncbi:MAG TPA: hypothetical protein VF832_01945, partial [Longimicrobiales bacterium]
YDEAQMVAWPAQLAAKVGVPFTLPLVQDPGCPPPLLSPLVLDAALVGVFRALGGSGDIVAALGGVCAPLQPGVTLPTNDVAISGANVHDALYETPQIAATISPGEGAMYSRVLLPGETQVTAMLAQSPTFVSVEMATNEILPASSGLLALVTPYARWQPAYDSLVADVASTGAGSVLVGLPRSAADFPSVRTAREFFSQWPYLLGLGIQVSISCYFSPNYLFVPGYLLSLLARAPTTATCADVPGAVDYVLTPSDVSAVNALMAQMNVHMQAQATARGYAYFDLSVLYDLPKIPFNMGGVLFSSQPFGPYMSIDGVHPNAAGQAILAQAAANAIQATYHVTIP